MLTYANLTANGTEAEFGRIVHDRRDALAAPAGRSPRRDRTPKLDTTRVRYRGRTRANVVRVQ